MPSKLFTDEVVHCGIVIEMESREIFPEAIGHYAGVHTTTTQLGQLGPLFFCLSLNLVPFFFRMCNFKNKIMTLFFLLST